MTRKTKQFKPVRFRKLDNDGSVMRTTNVELYVMHNAATDRFVVPVLLQEGTHCVVVSRVADAIQVDVQSERK